MSKFYAYVYFAKLKIGGANAPPYIYALHRNAMRL